MDLYNALEAVINFFVQPFLTVLERIGIENMVIRIGFNNIEWLNISLYNLIALIGNYVILYIFFRFIFRVLRKFVKIITGGMNL